MRGLVYIFLFCESFGRTADERSLLVLLCKVFSLAGEKEVYCFLVFIVLPYSIHILCRRIKSILFSWVHRRTA